MINGESGKERKKQTGEDKVRARTPKSLAGTTVNLPALLSDGVKA